jgi:hypothetical protein
MRVGIALAALVGTQGTLIAWAATNTSASDGGNTVKVGATNATSTPAAPPHPGGGTVNGSASKCTYTPMPAKTAATFGPGGPTPGGWYFVSCPGRTLTIYNGALSWFPSGSSGPAGNVPVPPSALAQQAFDSLTLPAPAIVLNPASFSVVNLPSWLWVDPESWHTFRATATAGGVSATAIAFPVEVSWSMGDGHTVVCDGPGTPYRPAISPEAQSTTCSYTYLTSSSGLPSPDGNSNDDAFKVTATITWTVTWTATGAPGGGGLPPLHTSSTVPVRVEQVEAVGTAG